VAQAIKNLYTRCLATARTKTSMVNQNHASNTGTYIIFLVLLRPFNHTFFRTSLRVLRTHIESRFCNPLVVILLN
jgi:hypothetical protein